MPKQADEDDDATLFREAVGPVKALPESSLPPRKPRPKPAARMAERDEIEARSEFQRGLDDLSVLAAGDTLSYRRDVVPAPVFQRLKRGRFSAQDELDLHGATVAQAESMLRTSSPRPMPMNSAACASSMARAGATMANAGIEEPCRPHAAAARRHLRIPLRTGRARRYRCRTGIAGAALRSGRATRLSAAAIEWWRARRSASSAG